MALLLLLLSLRGGLKDEQVDAPVTQMKVGRMSCCIVALSRFAS